MKYIIIGLGNFGTSLGLRLRDLDHEVIGIDTREQIVEEYKDKLTGTVCMNSVDEASLRAQSVLEVDAVIVAIGEDWAASIQTTALLKTMGVKRIIGRSLSKLHETVLRGLGIDEIINPENTAALEIANTIVSKNVVHTYNITTTISINEVTVPPYFENQTVADIDLAKNFGLTLVAIKYQTSAGKMFGGNKGTWQVTRFFDDFRFSKGDRIIVYGDNTQMRRLLDLFKK
ncbi:MAG: TrkA family potassium uptake protein [Bacteroidales bacterium]|jgi:trk system potassium uptake protein TrkA|nr:TrkA family potassium uptake protein [Bacteroidales bacterium]